MFAGIQALLALVLFLVGKNDAWNSSPNWWPIIVVITNLICLALLIRLYKAEGDSSWKIFKFQKDFVGKDLLTMLGFLVIASPLAFLPNILLGNLFFGNVPNALALFVRPLPMWAVIVSILFFPLSQGLVEIPTNMMFVMPRLGKRRASLLGSHAVADSISRRPAYCTSISV